MLAGKKIALEPEPKPHGDTSIVSAAADGTTSTTREDAAASKLANNLRREVEISKRRVSGMSKESSPLFVWLTVALLAFGALAYMTAYSAFEYLMTLL